MILYIQTNQPTFDFSQDIHMWGEHKKKQLNKMHEVHTRKYRY
jgi:hypothetical protein